MSELCNELQLDDTGQDATPPTAAESNTTPPFSLRGLPIITPSRRTLNLETKTVTETSTIPRNPAIQRCCLAEKRSRRESKSKARDIIETQICADEAYRKALPELVGYENIRDFIACVTYGMANDTITAFRGNKLLAGARLALSALSQEPAGSEKNKKESPKTAAHPEPAPLEVPRSLRLSSINCSD